MIEISSKNLEVDYPELLNSRFAVFIIEFDYDNRIYIGHSVLRQVQYEIHKFINGALDESRKSHKLLEESMRKSKILYVSIKPIMSYSLNDLLSLKYELIWSCGSYEPFGFNKTSLAGNKSKEEKEYIKKLLEKIQQTCAYMSRSPNAKRIKEYKLINKEYKVIAEWPSIKEAARHYKLNASNIASCCTGRLHTAYGRLWRYAD